MKTTGVERAAARLKEKRKANEAIPDTPIWTRQRRRKSERRVTKQVNSPIRAMINKMPWHERAAERAALGLIR